jgi:hypothetical protein
MNELPCVDCITVAICRGIYNSFPETDLWGAKIALTKKCSLLEHFVFTTTSNRDDNTWLFHAYMQNRDPNPAGLKHDKK